MMGFNIRKLVSCIEAWMIREEGIIEEAYLVYRL